MAGLELLFLGLISLNNESELAFRKPCEAASLRGAVSQVVRTSDGDTAVLRSPSGKNVKVRLLGIDTPETHYNNKSQGEWAERAADRLKELLPVGVPVTAKVDQVACDSLGRTLAYLESGGVDVNRQMIQEGWAVNYCVAPNLARCEEFGDLVENNIREGRGFLGDHTVELPYLFRAADHKDPRPYFIGDIKTKTVVDSSRITEVAIGHRVIFYSARHIRPPYRQE